jgi:serine/threonine protein kinase
LKIVLPQHKKSGALIAMLRHELSVGRLMDHPRVMRIYELQTAHELPYLAMDFFGPANLRNMLAKGREALAPKMQKIIEQAAEGLGYFHRQGWLHRDIKPNNFLVNDAGDVKLIDFALATRQKGFLGRLFGGGKIQGTRSYMAPEQIRGKALDTRADIYSFGCMMFELLTGRLPFTGNTENELLNKHLRTAAPSAEDKNPNITNDCSQLIKRMLAKEPSKRPESMEEVLEGVKTGKVFRSSATAAKKAT